MLRSETRSSPRLRVLLRSLMTLCFLLSTWSVSRPQRRSLPENPQCRVWICEVHLEVGSAEAPPLLPLHFPQLLLLLLLETRLQQPGLLTAPPQKSKPPEHHGDRTGFTTLKKRTGAMFDCIKLYCSLSHGQRKQCKCLVNLVETCFVKCQQPVD